MRNRFRRIVVGLVAVSLLAVGGFAVVGLPRAQAATYTVPVRTAVVLLPVATENRAGYDRTLFHHWIDADHDGCDTRKEVLIEEASPKPTVGASCTLTGGKWFSWYEGKSQTSTTALDIDHMVPLAEAWDSGARNWTAKQREAFANDLGDTRSLVAVTSSVNSAKGDKDPVDWLPPLTSARCKYVRNWVAVKLRWKLKVNQLEKNKLTTLANACPNDTITWTVASILTATTTTTTKVTTTTHANCAPSYPDFCIPPPPPDLDCADVAPHKNFTVLAPDPHHFDGDHDGKGCE